MNASKIINDPVYGFIQLPGGIISDIVQHPVFQRLRRIRQLGLANLVYPGAEHTRFQHALGAFHLMTQALDMLASKGVDISPEERTAAQVAILLHDIGHGPFSHSLEQTLLPYHHERLTLALMRRLNEESGGVLGLAIDIFTGSYGKPFLHELVTSQLDMDRLDYLNRDRFFTGVSEGVVGYDRIIHMLNVVDGHLVVEEKGIYSVEKFLVARRLMYWQVYLHKTSLAAETMLRIILDRGRRMVREGGYSGYLPAALRALLARDFVEVSDIPAGLLDEFAALDDHDIMAAVKEWRRAPDDMLAFLCDGLYERRLFKARIGPLPEIAALRDQRREILAASGRWSPEEAAALVHMDQAENYAYKSSLKHIRILFKDGAVRDISEASDNLDIRALSKTVIKHYVSYPNL